MFESTKETKSELYISLNSCHHDLLLSVPRCTLRTFAYVLNIPSSQLPSVVLAIHTLFAHGYQKMMSKSDSFLGREFFFVQSVMIFGLSLPTAMSSMSIFNKVRRVSDLDILLACLTCILR